MARTRTQHTIGGMNEAEALQVAYDAAYLDQMRAWPNAVPTIVQCDMRISEFRHSHAGKVVGAVSEWLCDRAAWDSSEREDNRRYRACRKAYKAAHQKYGM